MRDVNVNCLVLRTERVGERGARLSLFTREHGRLWARVKGLGPLSSKLAPLAQSPAEALCRLWKPESLGGGLVTGVKLITAFPWVRRDWRKNATAVLLCEWTERLTPLAQPSLEKYDLLKKALQSLAQQNAPMVRAAFMVQFLAHAGHGWEVPFELDHPVTLLGAWNFSSPEPMVSVAHIEQVEKAALRGVSHVLTAPLHAVNWERRLSAQAARWRALSEAIE